MIIKFTIDCIPIAKGRPKFAVRGGFARAYTPAKTRDYESMVADHARQHIAKPLYGPLCVDLLFRLSIPISTPKKRALALLNGPHIKKPDLDNMIKAVTDAFNGIAYHDDGQIAELHARKIYSDNPGVSVEISTI